MSVAVPEQSGEAFDIAGIIFQLLVEEAFNSESKAHSSVPEIKYLICSVFMLLKKGNVRIRSACQFHELKRGVAQ